METFARAEPRICLPLPRQCPNPEVGKLYVFLFAPYNSTSNSNYSMKSETVPTGKTENSLPIKTHCCPRLRKEEMTLHVGDCSGHRDLGRRGDPLWARRDPVSEPSAGSRTGRGPSAWPDFRTTNLSKSQRWGPHSFHLVLLCGTGTRRLLR